MMLKIDKTTNYEYKSGRGSSPQVAASSGYAAEVARAIIVLLSEPYGPQPLQHNVESILRSAHAEILEEIARTQPHTASRSETNPRP